MLGLLKALKTTLLAAGRKPVTVQYPTEKKELPHRARGFPLLLYEQSSRSGKWVPMEG